MKLNLNNSEVVAIFRAIENYLEYTNDEMILQSLLSFTHKINDSVRTFNRGSEEYAIGIMQQIEEIQEILKDIKEEGE